MMIIVAQVQDSNPVQYLSKRGEPTTELKNAREYTTYAIAAEAIYYLNLNPRIVAGEPIFYLGQIYSKLME